MTDRLSEAQKRQHIKDVMYSRTGVVGWDYIGPDSPEVIWELATQAGLRKSYESAIAMYPECDEAKELQRILNLAKDKMCRMANPIYDLNQTPSVKFKDLG